MFVGKLVFSGELVGRVGSVVRWEKDYWIKKNWEFDGGMVERENERVWEWCGKVWDEMVADRRYELGFVLWRKEVGEGYKLHRDRGSGRAVVLVVLSGEVELLLGGEVVVVGVGEVVGFDGSEKHGVRKGGKGGEYLVLFSKRLGR